MSFAVVPAADLEVVVAEDDAAGEAGKAAGVVLDAHVGLEVLALDAAVAGAAQAAVELVVVLLAVGRVVEDVELGGGEWGAARAAHEAVLVVAAGEASG